MTLQLLLASAAALVRARSARPALLDAYDDASDRLIEGLRATASRRRICKKYTRRSGPSPGLQRNWLF